VAYGSGVSCQEVQERGTRGKMMNYISEIWEGRYERDRKAVLGLKEKNWESVLRKKKGV